MPRILLVEDDLTTLNILGTLLRTEGYDVVMAPGGQEAQEQLGAEKFDLMVTDIFMTPINGRELLKLAREKWPDMGVIMLTAYGSVETAIEALKLGAYDYVTKPFKVDELLITVQRALEYCRVIGENIDLRAQLGSGYQFSNMVAESAPMKQVCEMIERVAPTDTAVLISGESGTGKELVAHAIHEHSRRKNRKFVTINCAALPAELLESEMFGHVKGAFTGATGNKEGLFEAADGGTMFLDEISSMPLDIQGKLLRTLQEKEIRRVGSNENTTVNVRILAATNIKLEEACEQGIFREDLYYRLNVIPITIAPLRERPEDLLPLVSHFLKKELGEDGDLPDVDPKTCALFAQYSWPGNVREIENTVKHALTFLDGKTITPKCLPPRLLESVSEAAATAPAVKAESDQYRGQFLKKFLKDKENEYLKQVLESTGGDKQRTAATLKISLATLYRKLSDSQEEE